MGVESKEVQMGKQYLKHLATNHMRDGLRDEEVAAWARKELRRQRVVTGLILMSPGLVALVAAIVIRVTVM
jgi:hypothetical protein